MKITATEEYGMRCMLQLALRHEQTVSLSELAAAEGIARAVRGQGAAAAAARRPRGRHPRPPRRLRASRRPRSGSPSLRILEALGKPLFDSGFCRDHGSPDASACSRLTDCSLRPVWAHLDALLKRFFENTTLADLAAGERRTDKHLQERWPLTVREGWRDAAGAGPTRERDAMNDQPKPVFQCAGVHIHIGEKEVVKGVDLTVLPGEVHAIMGPNGSGKSTLANGLMGHPAYAVEGTVMLAGEDVSAMPPDEKARKGMFLAFQYPVAMPGVTVASFLRAAVSAVRGVDRPGAGVPQGAARPHGGPRDGPRVRRPLPQRRVLRRREEARGDPPAAHAQAEVRHARRDRLRARHRRPEGRGQGDQRRGVQRHRDGSGHPLPAAAQLRPAPTSCTSS